MLIVLLLMCLASVVGLIRLAAATDLWYPRLAVSLGAGVWSGIGLLVSAASFLPDRSWREASAGIRRHLVATLPAVTWFVLADACLLAAIPGLWTVIELNGYLGGGVQSLEKTVLFGTTGGFAVVTILLTVGLLGLLFGRCTNRSR